MDELATLRARVELLERRLQHVLDVADTAQAHVSAVNSLDDGFVIPALLHLGGDVLREPMLRWLDKLVEEQRTWIEEEGSGQMELQRLEYWQDVLRKREPWPRFPPDGWMSPRQPGDGERPID